MDPGDLKRTAHLDRNSIAITLWNICLHVVHQVLHELLVRIIRKYNLLACDQRREDIDKITHLPSSIQHCHETRKPTSSTEFKNSGITIYINVFIQMGREGTSSVPSIQEF